MRTWRQPVAGWWAVAAIALLLGLAAAAAAYSAPQLDRLPTITETTEPAESTDQAVQPAPSAPAEPAEVNQDGMPGWLRTAAGGLGLAAALAAVGLAGWFLLRRGHSIERGLAAAPAESAPPDATEWVVAALDAGLLDLSDTDADPRRAVIACWLRLEDVAAAAGTPRMASDTATDLVTRLLRGPAGTNQRVSAAVLVGFAEVFRQARYAARPVDERMRVQARSALARLRAELTGTGVPA